MPCFCHVQLRLELQVQSMVLLFLFFFHKLIIFHLTPASICDRMDKHLSCRSSCSLAIVQKSLLETCDLAGVDNVLTRRWSIPLHGQLCSSRRKYQWLVHRVTHRSSTRPFSTNLVRSNHWRNHAARLLCRLLCCLLRCCRYDCLLQLVQLSQLL